jgi:hypothetical protein
VPFEEKNFNLEEKKGFKKMKKKKERKKGMEK